MEWESTHLQDVMIRPLLLHPVEKLYAALGITCDGAAAHARRSGGKLPGFLEGFVGALAAAASTALSDLGQAVERGGCELLTEVRAREDNASALMQFESFAGMISGAGQARKFFIPRSVLGDSNFRINGKVR